MAPCHHANRRSDDPHRELEHPPRRQLLGSDAWTVVRDALTERLEAVEAQREMALTTDADDFQLPGA